MGQALQLFYRADSLRVDRGIERGRLPHIGEGAGDQVTSIERNIYTAVRIHVNLEIYLFIGVNREIIRQYKWEKRRGDIWIMIVTSGNTVGRLIRRIGSGSSK